jgi:phospholipase/carboxylesterase
MRAWYDVFGFAPGSREDAAGVGESQAYIESLINKEVTRGIPANRIVLAGFSQGGAVVLHTALRHSQALAGVLALSTYLPLKASLALEKSKQNQAIPIFMAHGTFDNVISLSTCRVSFDVLQTQHYNIQWHEYPMAHSVNQEEIDDIRAFLLQVLKD